MSWDVQPVRDLVLPVTLVQRGELRRLGDPLGGLLLQLGQPTEHRGVQPAAGEGRQLVPHRRHPLAQRSRHPYGGRRRVVQLMGQPSRELTEGEQPLALADDLVGVAQPDPQPLEQVHRHREPGTHQPSERIGRDHQEVTVGHRVQGVAVGARRLLIEVGLRRTRVRAALVRPYQLYVVAADVAAHRRRPPAAAGTSWSPARPRRTPTRRPPGGRHGCARTAIRAGRGRVPRTGTACRSRPGRAAPPALPSTGWTPRRRSLLLQPSMHESDGQGTLADG